MGVRTLRIAVLAANVLLVAAVACASAVCVVQIASEGERRPGFEVARTSSSAPKLIETIKPFNSFSPIWTMKAVPGGQASPVAAEEDKQTARDQAERMLAGMIGILGVIPNVTAPEKGAAILTPARSRGNEWDVVWVGEMFEGAVVKRIIIEGVYFEFRGHGDLFLPYDNSEPPGIPGAPVARTAVGRRSPVDMAAGAGPAAAAGTGPPGSATEVSTDTQVYETFTETKKVSDTNWEIDPKERDYIVENHAKIRAEARLAPHFDSKTGQADGVEIRGAETGTLASRRGFQKDDIIKSVNGVAVTGLESVEALTQKFKSARSLTITYERRGKTCTTTFDVPNLKR